MNNPVKKQIRPEMIKPEFEIYIDKGNDEYVKQQKCTVTGSRTQFPGTNSALVPRSMKDLVVKLPEHRVFIVLGPSGPQEISGMVNLPVVNSLHGLYGMYMSAGSILEVDSKYIQYKDKYRYPRDINHKLVPPGATYLFTGQLAIWRGDNVATVGYLEAEPEGKDLRIGPNLTKNSYLPPLKSLLEQAHLRAVKSDPQKQHYVGTRVLEYASQIHYGNKYLVSAYPRKYPVTKKPQNQSNTRSRKG